MIKFGSLEEWSHLQAGELLMFDSEKARVVRLDVCLTAAGVMQIHDDKENVIMFPVGGRETVEFASAGPFGVCADVAMAVRTADMDVRHFSGDGQTSYARVVERKARNPELEEMEMRVMQNMQRILDSQAQERDRLIARRAAARVAAERMEDARWLGPEAPAGAVDAGNPSEPANGQPTGGDDAPQA